MQNDVILKGSKQHIFNMNTIFQLPVFIIKTSTGSV